MTVIGKQTRRFPRCLLLLGAVAALATTMVEAEDQAVPSAVSPQKVHVYVEDFKEVRSSQQLGDLGSFVASTLFFSLLENAEFSAHRVANKPPCGETSSPSRPSTTPGLTEQGIPRRARSAERVTGKFYVVYGSVELSADAAEFTVEVFIDSCEADKLKNVERQRKDIAIGSALDQTAILAGYLASTLASYVPRTKIHVEIAEPSDKELAAKAVQALKRSIRAAPMLENAETGDYVVSSQVWAPTKWASTKNSLGVPVPVKDTWNARIVIKASDRDCVLGPIETKKDDNDFFDKVTAAALQGIQNVRLAEEFHPEDPCLWARDRNSQQQDKSTQELLQRAEAFLCEGVTGCEPNAEAARSLLEVASKQEPDNGVVFLRLGEAQMSLAKYKDATASLAEAVTLLDSAGDSAKDLREEARYRLAEAYTQTGKYPRALDLLTAMLAENPQDGVLYLKESQVLENLDQRPEALEALLIGITKASDPAPLHEQAKLLTSKLQTADFPSVSKLFERTDLVQAALVDEHAAYLLQRGIVEYRKGAGGTASAGQEFQQAIQLRPSDPDILVELYCYMALLNLHSNPGEAESYLTKAKATVEDKGGKVTAVNREWLLRLRAAYLIQSVDCKPESEQPAQYQEVYQLAKLARQVNDSKPAQLLVARTALWVTILGSVATPSKWPPPSQGCAGADPLDVQQQKGLQEALALLKPLVDSRYEGADSTFMWVNHGLLRDEESRSAFASILAGNPSDRSASNYLGYVCNEFLFDFQCSFDVFGKPLKTGGSEKLDVGTRLNAVEASVLSGQFEQASEWIAPVLSKSDVAKSLNAVAYLYQTWITLSLQHPDLSSAAYLKWSEAVADLRKQSDQSLQPVWVFRGAKCALERSSFPSLEKERLGQMIATVEDLPVSHPKCPHQ